MATPRPTPRTATYLGEPHVLTAITAIQPEHDVFMAARGVAAGQYFDDARGTEILAELEAASDQAETHFNRAVASGQSNDAVRLWCKLHQLESTMDFGEHHLGYPVPTPAQVAAVDPRRIDHFENAPITAAIPAVDPANPTVQTGTQSIARALPGMPAGPAGTRGQQALAFVGRGFRGIGHFMSNHKGWTAVIVTGAALFGIGLARGPRQVDGSFTPPPYIPEAPTIPVPAGPAGGAGGTTVPVALPGPTTTTTTEPEVTTTTVIGDSAIGATYCVDGQPKEISGTVGSNIPCTVGEGQSKLVNGGLELQTSDRAAFDHFNESRGLSPISLD
jgi:hypothetical protein